MSAYVEIKSCKEPRRSHRLRLRQLANALLHRLPAITLRDVSDPSALNRLVGPSYEIQIESVYIDLKRLICMNNVFLDRGDSIQR